MLRQINLDSIKHNLLKKQVSRAINKDGTSNISSLLSFVDEAYSEHDRERRLTERTMDVMSAELMEANQDLLRQTKELKIEQSRYSLAAEAANDALWDWDLVTGTVYYSPRWHEMLLIPKSQQLNSIEDLYSRMHPDDLPLLKDMIQKHIDGVYPRIEIEFRLKNIMGQYIWVLFRGLARFDEDGNAIRIAGSQTDITIKKQHEAALYKAAYHDELTGIPNRSLFIDRLTQVIKREQHLGEKLSAVLFIDLDRFKYINDTMGHEFGDAVLKNVAQILLNNVRPIDTVARLGGDEFTVLLDSVENIEEAMQIAKRLLLNLNQSYEINGKDVFIASSIGLTVVGSSSISAQNILRNADLAMYEAKSTGKSRLAIFDSQHHQRLLSRMETESELRKAVSKGDLDVHYQPIIDLKTGEIVSFEALMRWFHPQKGYISPAIFIPIAEEVGLIGDMGEEILKKVCRQLEYWLEEVKNRPCPHVAVNISGRQLLDEKYYNQLVGVIKSFKYNSYLFLEITEGAVITDPTLAIERLTKIKELGVGLCIDDFGTGYSSLSYLYNYPCDILKIDQSFIKLLSCDKKSERLTTSIIGLAQDLGIKTVAEGVETEEQASKLRKLNCDFGQGFYFSKALSKEYATQLILNNRSFVFKDLEEAS